MSNGHKKMYGLRRGKDKDENTIWLFTKALILYLVLLEQTLALHVCSNGS